MISLNDWRDAAMAAIAAAHGLNWQNLSEAQITEMENKCKEAGDTKAADCVRRLYAENQRMSIILRQINNRLFGSYSDNIAQTIEEFDKLVERAYSTDYAWLEISKIVKRAAREVGDLKLENEKLRKKISELTGKV